MPIRTAGLAVLVFLLAAPTAFAGPPGKWSQLGQANVRNIDEVALARTADGTLHAVWTIPAPNSDSLVHDAIGPNGVVAPPNAITSGWATISNVPELLSTGDGLRVLFGGIRTTTPDEPNQNLNTATAPASGAAWDLFPGTVATGDAAYGSDTGAALLGDGTPLISWGGTGAGVFTHRGLDPNGPNFPIHSQLGGCCGYSPDVAVDPTANAPFIAWYSNADGKEGVYAQALAASGAPSGVPVKMPGSTTPFNGRDESIQMLQRTPIVARAGGGVYVAYSGGYPTATRVLLWRVGTARSNVLATSRNNHIVNVAADSDGRLWILWVDRGTRPAVFARRSNKSATKFGPAVKAAPVPSGQTQAYRIAGNAQASKLDVVVLLGGVSTQAHWHTQLQPGLAATVAPKKKSSKGGTVTVTVSDPDPVSGAKVAGGGDSATTNKSGKATLEIAPTKKRSVKLKITKAGYVATSVRLKIG